MTPVISGEPNHSMIFGAHLRFPVYFLINIYVTINEQIRMAFGA
jgi:hypothetical protein